MGGPELAIGRRFELVERVGRGAFGEVFRAVDRDSGAVVAVKRLLEHQDAPTAIDRFEREAKLLARIDSPYVVRYVAHGHDERGRPCLALEWLEGEDMARRQRRRPLSFGASVEAVRQAALGLEALHEAGIVHRDIKPSNFFLVEPEASGERTRSDSRSEDVRLKLLDLGIARARSEDALTLAGVRIGTPSYMSPEQARGDDDVTAESDLFSLGVVLYELLSGRRPFAGEETLVVLAKIVLQEPVSLDRIVIGLPQEIITVVARAMAKAPADRIASARELARMLAAAPRPRLAPQQIASRHSADGGETVTMRASASSSSVSATREQRVITAVFAGFADAADPEEAQRAFSRIAAALGGVTHKTLGWRMIAVFGGARSTGDEVVRAARVALSASTIVAGIQLTIATGRAVTGDEGISADAIERGAGAEGSWSGIRVDAPTARLLAPHFVVEGVGGSYLLRGERLEAGLAGPRLLGRETPTVGRDRELAMLEAMFDECADEPIARVAVVTALAGTGKSRLRFELLRRLEKKRTFTTLMARGDSLSVGSPFAMIAEMVKLAAGVRAGESLAAQRAKIAARASRHVAPAAAKRVSAFLGELAGVPFDDAGDAALRAARADAIMMGDAKRAAWEDWLEAELENAPVMLVFEDLHWGDVPTVKLVDAALRRLRARPLFVLALARPELHEQFKNLWVEREAQEVRLGALTKRAATTLVREVLGTAAPDDVIERVVERAEGNAFYLEELIRTVAEGTSDLPDTVLGMVQARLDALGSEPKRILRAASIFGRAFWLGGVTALCGGDDMTRSVSAFLDELVDREVVLRLPVSSLPGTVEYAFRHALLRDAAYAMLADADRVTGHRLAGEWLRETGGADPIVLAEHFVRGGDPAQAAPWYRTAAEAALQGNDFARAIERAQRGAGISEARDLYGAFHLILAEAHRWAGQNEEASAAATVAREEIPRGTAAWFRAMSELLTASNRRADLDVVESLLLETAAVEAEPDAVGPQVATMCTAAGQLIQAGRYVTADQVGRRISELAANNVLGPIPSARVAQFQAFCAYREGDPSGARDGYLRALEAFESAGSDRNATIERVNVGFASGEVGDYEGAEFLLREALDRAARMGLTMVQVYACLNLGRVLQCTGRLDEARRMEERAEANSMDSPRSRGAARIHLSNIALKQADFGRAERDARAAVSLLATSPPLRAGALASLARALSAQGKLDEALAAAESAMEIVRAGKLEMFDVGARLTHAEILDAVGRTADARAWIADLCRLIRERASRFGDPRWRESYMTRVEENRRAFEIAKSWGVEA